MSLVSASLSPDPRKRTDIPGAICGNICRCTGYKSIEKAAEILNELASLTNGCDPVYKMVETGYLPEWFLPVPGRLAGISRPAGSSDLEGLAIGGGTDLMVQQPEKIFDKRLNFTGRPEFRGIESDGKTCTIGAGGTITDLMKSEILLSILPDFEKKLRLVSSEQIRNMGTVGGNLVNASPIADLTIIFLVFDTALQMCDHTGEERAIPLKDFYLGYKILDRKENEVIRSLRFRIPGKKEQFNFEKVSKREHLDIASVNSAICVQLDGNRVTSIRLSAGGVAPVPKFLAETCRFMTGRELSPEMLIAANHMLQDEISPISDIRGSAEYKRLLIRQLLFAHFLELFPGKLDPIPLITLSSQK
jgi:xanthine dehydrogenase small subunit